MKMKDFYCHINGFFLQWIAQHCVFYSTLTSLKLWPIVANVIIKSGPHCTHAGVFPHFNYIMATI